MHAAFTFDTCYQKTANIALALRLETLSMMRGFRLTKGRRLETRTCVAQQAYCCTIRYNSVRIYELMLATQKNYGKQRKQLRLALKVFYIQSGYEY